MKICQIRAIRVLTQKMTLNTDSTDGTDLHGFEVARGWLIVRLTSRRIPKSSYSNEYGTKIQPQSTLTSYGVECLLRPQGVQVAEGTEL